MVDLRSANLVLSRNNLSLQTRLDAQKDPIGPLTTSLITRHERELASKDIVIQSLKAELTNKDRDIAKAGDRISALAVQLAQLRSPNAPPSWMQAPKEAPPPIRKAPDAPVLYRAREKLFLRTGPHNRAPVLRVIPAGADGITATDRFDYFDDPQADRLVLWREVRYDGIIGWACAWYLKAYRDF